MPEAFDIHGSVFKNGSAVFLGRVVGADGTPITPAQIAAARYTVALLDPSDADTATPVPGHQNVALEVRELVYDALQRDALWNVDALGYNFKHVLDVRTNPAFPVAGRPYRVEFVLVPVSGQVILVRFRVHAI